MKKRNEKKFEKEGVNKKALSPVIATVLLVAITIVLFVIILLWYRSTVDSAIIKFNKNIELVCEDVKFEASFSAGTLQISNYGEVDIYSMKIKVVEDSGHETIDLTYENSEWPQGGLGGSQAVEIKDTEIIDQISTAKEIVIIPVLVGTSQDSGAQETHTCDERNGVKEVIN